MKFCVLILELHLLQNFCHLHTQTDRHIPEIVKPCLDHLKTCKSIKNRKSKIFTKPILSSVYLEENNKELHKKLNFAIFTKLSFKIKNIILNIFVNRSLPFRPTVAKVKAF